MSTVQQAVVFGFDIDAEAFKRKVGALGDRLAPQMEALGKRIGASLRQTFTGVQELIASVFKKLTIGAAAAGTAIGVFSTMMGRSFLETARFAKSIGVSTQEMRTMQSAARIAGADVESLNQSFRMFREKMGEAQSLGTGEAIEALDGLKLRVEDLQNASLPEVFDIINQRIQTLGLNSAQARDYVEKLGIEYDTFSAIVSNGALAEAQTIMAKFGIITAEQEDTFIRVSQKVSGFWEVIRNLGLEIAEGLMPLLDTMTDILNNALPDSFGTTSNAVTAFSATAVSAIGEIIAKVYELIGALAQSWADLKASFDLANQFEVRKGSIADAAMTGWSNLFGDGSHDMGDGYKGPGAPDVMGPWNDKAGASRQSAADIANGILLNRPLPSSIYDAVNGSASDIGSPSTRSYPNLFTGTNAAPTGGGAGGGGGATKALKDEASAAREAARAYAEKNREAKAAFEEMYPRIAAIQDISARMAVTAQDSVGVWNDAFQDIGESIAEFVKNGKLDFDDLFSSMASSFINHAMQMAMYGQNGGGGLWGMIGSLFGANSSALSAIDFAGPMARPNWNGNVINKPTKFFANGGLASMSEKGAEAILPLQRNARGQLGVVADGGSGGGGDQVININTTINAQATGNPTEDANVMAKQFNRIIETKIVDVLAKQRRTKLGGY